MGLPLGAIAPVPFGEDIFGRPVSLGMSRGKKTLVYFVSTRCSSCRDALRMVHALHALPEMEVIVIFNAPRTNVLLLLAELWRNPEEAQMPFLILTDEDGKTMQRYQVTLVPYLNVVDDEGFLGAKGMPGSLSETAFLCNQSDRLLKQRHERKIDIPLRAREAAPERPSSPAAHVQEG